MRVQFQQGGSNLSSQVAAAPIETGVSTVELTASLETAWAALTPRRLQESAGQAVADVARWISSRPPAGVSAIGNVKRSQWQYQGSNYRLDVENLSGDNLRE